MHRPRLTQMQILFYFYYYYFFHLIKQGWGPRTLYSKPKPPDDRHWILAGMWVRMQAQVIWVSGTILAYIPAHAGKG